MEENQNQQEVPPVGNPTPAPPHSLQSETPLQPSQQPQGVQPLTPPDKPKSKKKLIIGLIVVALLLVAGGIAAFFYFQSQKPLHPSKPVPPLETTPTTFPNNPTSTVNPTISWNEYSNGKLGYKIKLPIDLGILSQTDTSDNYATSPPMTEPYLTITTQLTDFENTDLCENEEDRTPCIVPNTLKPEEKLWDQTEVDKIPASIFTIYRNVGRRENVVQTTKEPFIELRFLSNNGYPPTFHQILSTLKFIKPQHEREKERLEKITTKDTWHTINVKQKTGAPTPAHHLGAYLREPIADALGLLDYEVIKKIITNTTNTNYSSADFFNAQYYVLLGRTALESKNYENESLSINVTLLQDQSLIPYFLDNDYCRKNSDCVIRNATYCDYGAFNKFEEIKDHTYGCTYTTDAETGIPAYEYECKDIKYSSAECVDNKCAGLGRTKIGCE